ncbi:MAG: intradiol ring-cleavage dioxygenase [Burkholderiales bacterium]|nr:intradiol ring-cleavage dioxygenase [Burkholderiales bacterium]
MHHHPEGLLADLPILLAQQQHRRRLLTLSAGLLLAGCGGGGSDSDGTAATPAPSPSPSPAPAPSSCALIPEETAGPYPGDGSNSSGGQIANALALTGIVRQDMRRSIAGASGLAEGVPLTLTLQLVNANGGCANLADYAVYLWHCDREGRYSMYSSGVTGENYLRAVQVSGSDGRLSFVTIFPGCYDGRMPHMHFEVFRSSAQATSFASKIRTSQIAFPTDVCTSIYNNAAGYTTSRTNFARISFATDNVFSDGTTLQMASVSGDLTNGYQATLVVGVGG